MTARAWLAAVAASGVIVFALSFVRAWVAHERELRGEGYRFVSFVADAWREPAAPLLTVAVVLALVVGVAAALALWRHLGVSRSLLLVGSATVLALMVASAVPIAQDGHASSVDVRMAVLMPVGIGLSLLMTIGAATVARPRRTGAAAVAGAVILVVVGGVGGRWWLLQASEGTGRHWSDGSYVRRATGGEPTERMTIAGDRVTIGDRWQGTWEWSGWTVVIDDDAACPDSRGTYHARGVNDDDLRFVMVVDTCRDGARAADLQTGVWERED